MIPGKFAAVFALTGTLAAGSQGAQSCDTKAGSQPARNVQQSSSRCLAPGAKPGTYGGPIEVSSSTGKHLDFRGTCDHCGHILTYSPRTASAKRGMQTQCDQSADFEHKLNG